VGIAHLGLDYEWLWVNQRFCDILGYKREELVEKRLEDITHPEDREPTGDLVRRAIERDTTDHSVDKRYIRPDGSTVWAHLTLSVVREPGDEPSYVVVFLEDATSRRLAGQRLAAQYAVARVVADARTVEGMARATVQAVCEAMEWDAGALWLANPDGGSLRYIDGWHRTAPMLEALGTQNRKMTLQRGEGLPGRVLASGRHELSASQTEPGELQPREILGAFAFPVSGGGRTIGALEFFTIEPRRLDNSLLRAMVVIGGEIGEFVERTRAEQFASDQEVRKTAVVDAALDCIVMMDAEGRITEFNRAAEKTFGYAMQDVIGKSMAELMIPARFREQYVSRVTRFFEESETDTLLPRGEVVGMRADGSEFPMELAIRRIPVEGSPSFAGFIRDITDRKQAQEDLQHSLSLLQATLESTADGLLVVDHEGRIVSFNQKMADMWGIPREVLESGDDMRAIEIALEKLRHPERFLDRVRALYATPDESSFDELALKDGRTLERYSQPQRLGGKSVGRVWSFRDVTERKNAERQTRQLVREQAARAQAEEARERASFLAEASRVLSSSFDYHTTLAALARLAVPTLADYCTIDVMRDDGSYMSVGGHSSIHRRNRSG
jgi:PAS domain S-box-containing protein